MVFGWGKKKEDLTERDVPLIRNISLTDVSRIISELLELRKSQAVSEIRLYKEHIIPLLDELIYIGRALEKDDLNTDDIDRNIRIIVIRGKKQVIDVITRSMDLPDVATYDDAVLLDTALNQILKKVGDALGRQTRVIHIFAKKYATKLKDILADVNSDAAEIKKLLQNLERDIQSSVEINDALGRISSTQQANADADQKIITLKNNLAECEDRIASHTKSINEIKSSPEYAELLELEGKLDRLCLDKSRLNTHIMDTFTKISRPLSRYQYASSLDKEQSLLLSKLIESPFDALTVSNKDSIIVILENIKKGITSGSISVKDREKSTSQITKTEELLDGMINDISECVNSKADIQDRIKEKTSSRLPALERDLETSVADKARIESRINTLAEEISTNKENIPDIINDIQALLCRFSNTQYTITKD